VSLDKRGMLRQASGCTFPRFAALPRFVSPGLSAVANLVKSKRPETR
jgi:hypothetical protein